MSTPNNSWRTVDLDRGECVDLTGMGDLATRQILETHWHSPRDDGPDEWINLPVRAVIVDGAGPAVEIGPWSISPDDARLLALSLNVLADLADGTREVTR